MSGWQVAGSLQQLLDQLNQLAPHRSKVSDGSIGDAAHASRDSDHNPWWILNGQAYVTARDFTHDPAGGLNCDQLAASLTIARDPRVKYVIWNGRIMSGATQTQPWVWRPYHGRNRHTTHLHLSVVADARSLVRIPWALPALTPPHPEDWFDMASKDELYETVMDALHGGSRPVAQRGDVAWSADQIMTALGFDRSNAPATLPADELAKRELARRSDVGYLQYTLSQLGGQLDALREAITSTGDGAGAGPVVLDYGALARALLTHLAETTSAHLPAAPDPAEPAPPPA
ncbi:MAG: hypothetical protein L0H84_04525 [Pseudonocardia sp.]|nr:hypothetical protein [Pseudonocardia sp.]